MVARTKYATLEVCDSEQYLKKGTKAQLQAFIHALERVPTSLDLVCRCSDRKKTINKNLISVILCRSWGAVTLRNMVGSWICMI